MDSFSVQEQEQIKRFEQLRKLLQMIMMSHIRPIIVFFVITLAACLAWFYISARRSSSHYEANVVLHYVNTDKGGKTLPPKFTLALLNRYDIRQRFLMEYRKKYGFGARCSIAVEEIRDKKRGTTEGFKISVKAVDERSAVRIANDFADFCVETYSAECAAALQVQLDELNKKKERALIERERLKTQKRELAGGVGDPKGMLRQLERSVETNRRLLMDERMLLDSLEKSYRELEAEMRAFNPALISCEKELRRLLAERKKLADELERLRDVYTDDNDTKMGRPIERLKQKEAELRRFLAERKLTEADIDRLDAALELHGRMEKLRLTIVQKRNRVRMLEAAVRSDEAKIAHLRDIMPQIEILDERQRTYDESLARFQASISDIRSRLVKDGIRIGERAESAAKIKPLGSKKVVMCIILAILLTGVMAALIVMRDFLFGRVTSDKDLILLPGIRYLGALPTRDMMFESKNQEQIAFNTIYHAFMNSGFKHQVVLVNALPGGKIMQELFDAFERNHAMSGKRTLCIDVVLADTFDYDMPGAEDMGIIVHSGSKGVMPVITKKFLSPSEIELLKNDLLTLRNSYDLILIRHSASMRHDRMFVEQIMPLCDSLIIAAGLNKTTRKHLRRLTALSSKSDLPIMTILSDSSTGTAGKHNNLEVGK